MRPSPLPRACLALAVAVLFLEAHASLLASSEHAHAHARDQDHDESLFELDPEHPMITPSPVAWSPSQRDEPEEILRRRDLLDDVTADFDSIISGLGSNIPSYVASGIPNFFQNFPVASDVESSLGLNSSQVAALPTQVLNLPPYGNYTDQGWQIRFRANVYKQPNISSSKLDDLANGFLIGTSVQALPSPQASQARNLTEEIYVIQQAHANVTFSLAPASTQGPDGGAVKPSGGNQIVAFPTPASDEGDIDGFASIKSNGLEPGNSTSKIQVLDVWTQGTGTGNATAYLVPDTGITVISDIDDILRITQIYEPKEGLLNSFARAYVPWMNMPEIYANWSSHLADLHFHYLTTLPEQVTRNYMEFIFKTYPLGSFDTRPLNFTNIDETLQVRKYLLEKIFRTFPKRKFVLVADTSNSDVMRDYPAMATEFPGQVQCIWLRNTTNTDPGDRFPYDTSGFKNLNTSTYMFFVVPDDLKGLDWTNGQCVNSTVKQNVTFSYQGLPSIKGNGSSSSSSKNAASGGLDATWVLQLPSWPALLIVTAFLFVML